MVGMIKAEGALDVAALLSLLTYASRIAALLSGVLSYP